MSFLGRKPADAIATTADIADGVVTAAKLAGDFDDNIQTNIALLGFKVAVNGSLAKYDLQDQIVDEYTTNAGVNTGDSTNEVLTAGAYRGEIAATAPAGGTTVSTGGTNGVPSGYTVLKFTADGALTVVTAGNISVLVVAGGGSGGNEYGGGAGAGGLVYDAVYAVTANTYDAVIGDGGVGQATNNANGLPGDDTTFTINGGAVQFTAKGGGYGGGGAGAQPGGSGGSGGGNSYTDSSAGASTQAAQSQHGTVDVNIGYAGGIGFTAPDYNPGGGGGAGSVGVAAVSANSGAGGTGYNASAIFGTAVGDSGYFASGGGGGYTSNGNSVGGTASSGGGTAGGASEGGNSSPALDNTGGGSGGGSSGYGDSGNGGSGVVLVRYANADFGNVEGDLILQSSDTTAESAPTKADMVILVEDAGSGVASLDTSSGNIKGWVSMYETGDVKTWTQVPLVDEGHWGVGPSVTGKRILAAHDVTLTGTSGTQMAYKITTHSASAVYDTRIHATSIGWR